MRTLPQTSDSLRNEAVVIMCAAERAAREMVAAVDAVRAAHARARAIEFAAEPFMDYLKNLRDQFPESTPDTIIVGGPYNLTYAHFDALAAALVTSQEGKTP